MMDARRRLLDTWLPEALLQAQQTTGWSLRSGELSPASSGASFRRYFRWHDGQHSLIIMDAPPPQEDVRPFMRIAALLAEAGVHTPAILAADPAQGFLLLEDLGTHTDRKSTRLNSSHVRISYAVFCLKKKNKKKNKLTHTTNT